MSGRPGCRAKNENKIKTYEQKAISLYGLRHVVTFSMTFIYKLGKVDDKILILQLDEPEAKNKVKTTEILIEKDGFKIGIRVKIRLKCSRKI